MEENVTKRQYRKFKPEQKFKIVKEALTTDTKISELCEKYEVKSSHFYNWQEQFYRGAREAFERSNDSGPSKPEQRRIEELERENQRMKSVIAEITAENIDLKKNNGDW
jgi:transposase-like protein